MINTLEIASILLEFKSKVILNNVYLKSETGKITGLLGRNGTGKSSLMKIIFGEINPKDKSIRINNSSLLTPYRSPKDLKYLPQSKFLPMHLTLQRLLKDFDLEFSDLISFFPELKKHHRSKLINLSSGERRIVETYLILVSETKFCMLDEPFTQLMPIHIEIVKALIVREKQNKGIIITDHMHKHITEISDELYIIKDGKTHLTTNIKGVENLGYIKNL